MTVTEFKNEFNILYDSISSNQAPDLDDYEISVLLTKAQLELVKTKFHPESNKLNSGFEFDSKRRSDLKELIRDYKTSLTYNSNNRTINARSQFFVIPSDILFIIHEHAFLQNNIAVDVIPKTHDEFNIQIKNPFKKPDQTEIWRLDYSSKEAGNRLVELVTDGATVATYALRYLKYPSPIILSDLTSFGEGLSINGLTQPMTSELVNMHEEILDRAVELAIKAYRENNLSNQVQLNLRNE